MPNSKPLTQRRALRALAEGARPTMELLADASGRSARTLALEAARDKWALDRAPQEDIAERVRAIARPLLERLETLGRAAVEEGGKIDKAEIETIVALVRGLDRIDIFMRPPEEIAKEKQIRRDENLADVLQRINDRIVALAKEFAAGLGAQGDRQRGSGTRKG